MTKNQLQLHKYTSGLPPGDEHRVNHEDCPAGIDTRERLYIKKVDNGWIGHCFNCGESGYLFRKETRRLLDYPSRDPYDVQPLAVVSTLKLEDYIPVEYRVWLYKHYITDELTKKYGIKWDAYTERLYVPYETDGSYQLRTLRIGSNKWLTYPGPGGQTTASCVSTYQRLVFVEDIISYIRVKESLSDCSVVALLGTNYNKILTNEWWIKYIKMCDCLIWFDADRPGAVASLEFTKELRPIAKSVQQAAAEEPKLLSPKDIEGVLNTWAT